MIRTQKERNLQTLIEVCTDFSSLVSPTHLHRPAEQTFAVHQQSDSYTEEVEDQDDVFAVGDRPPWDRRSPDTSTPPSLQQMFALARRMGYEMRPIAGQPDAQRRPPGNHSSPDQNRGFRPPARTGRDYSRIRCFSCGEFGHMQSCCQRPDSTLPFKPAGWQQQPGKLLIDRDITPTGIYALHPAPLSSSHVTWTSSPQTKDIDIITTHSQSNTCTEKHVRPERIGGKGDHRRCSHRIQRKTSQPVRWTKNT